jgi:pyruvate/2-oxoglutarate dehydrogenase complex dihydrolipoamide acyltransferase (E2) component
MDSTNNIHKMPGLLSKNIIGGWKMIKEITMPKIGMMNADIKLAEWFVKEGDKVEAEQELCEIESQKITNTIPVKKAGTVLKILVEEDKEVPIGTVLAIVGDDSDDISNYS